jgi:hypothetical protein
MPRGAGPERDRRAVGASTCSGGRFDKSALAEPAGESRRIPDCERGVTASTLYVVSEPAGPRPTMAALIGAMRDYLALPEDPVHIPFSLAVAVAASFDGDPLWGLLVGPPSSGKTEMLRALDDVADEHLDEITAAGLLSWLPGRKPRPTGLLSRRQGRVFATIGDLSTLLAKSDRGDRDQLYAILRRAYDGRVVREVGNAPEPLRWEGRFTALAGVTPAVDRYASHSDALGPRWLYLRVPGADTELRREASRKSRAGGATLSEHRVRVRSMATALVRHAASRPAPDIDELLGEQLDDVAIVTCLGRADVPRDGYGRREIIGFPVVEEPPRLSGQLAHLARGLLALGFSDADAAALCRRAALDSMPLPRRACLGALSTGERLGEREVARRIDSARTVARMTLEDLEAIGVATYDGAERNDENRRGPWRLDGPDAGLIARVMTSQTVVPKSGQPPPNPPRRETDGEASHTSEPPQHACDTCGSKDFFLHNQRCKRCGTKAAA